VTEKRLTVILYGRDRNLWRGGPLQIGVSDLFASGGPRPLYQGETEESTLELPLDLFRPGHKTNQALVYALLYAQGILPRYTLDPAPATTRRAAPPLKLTRVSPKRPRARRRSSRRPSGARRKKATSGST
jgi:hypothetical protein